MYRFTNAQCNNNSNSRSKSANKNNHTNRSPKSLKKTYGSKTSLKQQSSPMSKGLEQLDLANKMKKTRSKLCNTLDAYILIKQTGAPLRCIQHNSVLSLYCETQQKLLCANCVYRSQVHRVHRVHPIDQCNKMLIRDIDLMERQMVRQIQSIQNIEKQIQQVFKQQQKSASQVILTFAQQFQQIQAELRKSYQMIKMNTLKILDKICYKQQALLLQLGFFKDIYKKNMLPGQEQVRKCSQMDLMYYHLIGNSIMNNNKVGKIKVMIEREQIKNFEKKEMKYLKKIKSILSQWNGSFMQNSRKSNLSQNMTKMKEDYKKVLLSPNPTTNYAH